MILSGGSPDNACRLGTGKMQKAGTDNQRVALAVGSSLERDWPFYCAEHLHERKVAENLGISAIR